MLILKTVETVPTNNTKSNSFVFHSDYETQNFLMDEKTSKW